MELRRLFGKKEEEALDMTMHMDAECSNIEQGKELILNIGRIVNCLKNKEIAIDDFMFIWDMVESKFDKELLLKDLEDIVGNDFNMMIEGNDLIIES